MITQKLLDHDEPVRVRVRGEHDEEPPEPDQLRRVRRERRVAAAHVEARDEHGPMRSVSSPPPPYHALSRHPASRRWRRETNAQSGRVDGVEAEAEKHTQSTPSTRSFKDTEQRTGADRNARGRRRTPRPARRCTVYNEAPSRASRTGSPVSSGLVVSRLRASSVTPSPRRAKDAGAAPW